MSQRILVISYEGEEMTTNEVTALHDVMMHSSFGITNVAMYSFSEGEIAKLIGKEVIASITPKDKSISALDSAAIYIAEKYKDCANLNDFISNLSGNYILACLNNSNVELINAVRILGSAPAVMAVKALKDHSKWNLKDTRQCVEIIRDVYNNVTCR